MRRIHVSYRLPISFENKNGKTVPKPSAGGLATALSSTAIVGGEKDLWLGVSDISASKWSALKGQIESDFELVPIFFTSQLNSAFYKGFSNSVLWPLFHYFPSFVEFKESSLSAYQRANAEMAQKVAECYREGDLIWIHDYHFLLLPGMVRSLLPNAKIGFFLHIPFPNIEVFRLLPSEVKCLLLEGMMGANLIGFQTWGYATNFVECIARVLGRSHSAYRFEKGGYWSQVGIFPISIDFDKFYSAYDDPVSASFRSGLRLRFKDHRMIFSVDRLDYTKGVMYRLNAFELFLERHPELLGRVVFCLVIVPSREEIQKYGERRQLIEQIVNRINGLYIEAGHVPVVYLYQSVSFQELIGYFTSADLALISPVRDGMNLVAKEFVASRKDQLGVLMLSELAGASDELQDALLFNPLDTAQMADQIHIALEMPDFEQKRRMQSMQAYIRKHTVFHWADDFLHGLEQSCSPSASQESACEEVTDDLIARFRSARRRLFLFDYDGTLVGFHPQPEMAAPDPELKSLLENLGSQSENVVAIVSGRDRKSLDDWLGDLPLTLIAEHGAYVKQGSWKSFMAPMPTWKEDIKGIMKRFADMHAESFVEEKSVGIAWHYRKMEVANGFAASRALIGQLRSYLMDAKAMVIDGNRVVEVKPINSDKGNAISKVFNLDEFDCVLAIGDDRTDEDMFDALGNSGAFTVKVGLGQTSAHYRVEGIAQVIALLKSLV